MCHPVRCSASRGSVMPRQDTLCLVTARMAHSGDYGEHSIGFALSTRVQVRVTGKRRSARSVDSGNSFRTFAGATSRVRCGGYSLLIDCPSQGGDSTSGMGLITEGTVRRAAIKPPSSTPSWRFWGYDWGYLAILLVTEWLIILLFRQIRGSRYLHSPVPKCSHPATKLWGYDRVVSATGWQDTLIAVGMRTEATLNRARGVWR